MLTVVANAKINLGLEVVGRRDDGYHEVVTILQEIGLGDRIFLRRSRTISFESDDLSIAPHANLVLRAACRLQRIAAIDLGAEIRLEKSIPIGGGLGGGSSDAAATLRGLNQLWALNLGDETLVGIARSLGTDVAFFLFGGTYLARGRGDELCRLPTPGAWVVVVYVDNSIPNKTRTLYESLRQEDFSDGGRVRSVASCLRMGDEIPTRSLVNCFERPALEILNGVRRAFEAIRAAGAKPLLAGSGPTVLSIHRDELDARVIAEELRREGFSVAVAPTVAATETDLSTEPENRYGRRPGVTEA